MKKTFAAMAIGVLVSALVLAQDSERKVKMQDLPAAVQKAVKAYGADAKIRGLATEMDKGKMVYEAELTVGGHSKDVTFDADGQVLSVEEETTLANIPAPARAAIESAAGKGKVTEVETVTEGGKTFYEAQVKTGGKKSEIKVDATGALVK
jgi:uncharacterized membrane protein YkoI